MTDNCHIWWDMCTCEQSMVKHEEPIVETKKKKKKKATQQMLKKRYEDADLKV